MIQWIDEHDVFGVIHNEDFENDLKALAKNHFAEFDSSTEYRICAIDYDKMQSTIYQYEIERTETISCTVY